MIKDKKKKYFMNVAILTSDLSTCISNKVGAVLTKDDRIVSIGYNGSPSGCTHCEDIFSKNFDRDEHHNWSLKNELHAEQNIISFCAKNGINTNGTTMYITLSPCIDCAKLLLSAGIKEVYYRAEYDYDNKGINFLRNKGVKCERCVV